MQLTALVRSSASQLMSDAGRTIYRATEELVYVVLYEHDPASRRGFVYLPGRSDHYYWRNVRTILRDLEGSLVLRD